MNNHYAEKVEEEVQEYPDFIATHYGAEEVPEIQVVEPIYIETPTTPEQLEEVDAYGAWPPVNKFTTFKADIALYQWNGKQLVAFKGATGTAKVDGDRSKIKLDASVTLPVVGKVAAEIMVDTKAGYAINYIPAMKVCQKQPLPIKMDLKAFLNKLYSEDGGLTTYDGRVKPVWDQKEYDKFHSSVTGSAGSFYLHSYIDPATHNGRWLQEETSAKEDPKLIVSVPKGEEPAKFADSDFVITGCAPKAYTPEEEFFSIW